MKREDWIMLLVAIVVLVVLYHLSKFLSWFGQPDNATDPGTSQDDTTVNTANLTYPIWDYKAEADKIYANVWDKLLGFVEDDDGIEDSLVMMYTNDDFKQLVKAYGIRGVGIVIKQYYNLPHTLTLYLNASNKKAVNETYAMRGITKRV